MRREDFLPLICLSLAVCAAHAQSPTPATTPAPSAAAKPSDSAQPNRASAYYHAALAGMYEEQAVSSGRAEYVQPAIEEYKAAINADPGAAALYDGLADLYFRTGKTRDAESTAREVIKNHPNDIDAHKLLGRIYLRQLGEQQNSVSSSSPSGNTLDQAIAEFEKIVAIQPRSVEDRMILGQLYTVKHQSAKAEEQFKIAQDIEPESEEVVLNLARVYQENNNFDQAAKVLEAVPENDRTARMEFTLGATYDQLKRTKDAIAAYKRAADMQPGDVPTLNALAQAQFTDNQFDEALKTYKDLAQADSEDAGPLVKISEIQRREGKYEDALATIRKARKKDPESLEAGYNEGLLLDVLGRYDEAATTYQQMVDQTSHANGAYTAEEKNNRSIFLERLGSVNHEQNKVDQAIAAYQKMIDMGGDSVSRGYQLQVDTYNDAKMFEKAVEVSKQAVAANPKDRDLKLMLAGELVDLGKSDDGLNMAKSLLTGNDSDDRSIYFGLGNMYTRLRRFKEAEEVLAKATPMATRKEDKLYLLFLKGALADRQKHLEEAESYFRKALEIDPNNAMTLNYMGYMFADKGVKLQEALKLIRKAVDQEPMNGAYLDSLGWAYFKLGEYEMAEENLRQAVERDQTDPTVHDHLGDLYEKTGRIRLAAAQWELSVTQYQKTPQTDQEPGDMAKVQHKLEGAHVRLAKQESTSGVVKPE
ncbi:tetratricopeptide repeat protein [Occallatibacter riparius]|uniref:Tetratricopeptide repeat protein n=1 Tax=Occallatibacter riparius TaxID=1002689 RepID=A0A9J7BYU9_9BACT|nr:tetratricopeptide repeat protein [Occallatibacter riparius]UWZ86781.1 tetratricopeptide repeat protein [Occallatibacter riparius]